MAQFRVDYMPGEHDCRPEKSQELEFYPAGTEVTCNWCGTEWRLSKTDDGSLVWNRPYLRHKFTRFF